MVNVNVTPLPLNPVIKVWNSSIISRFGVNQTSWIFIQLFTHKIFHLLPTFSFFSSPPPHVPTPPLHLFKKEQNTRPTLILSL